MKYLLFSLLFATCIFSACRQQINVKSKVKGNFVVYSELKAGEVAEIYLTEETTYYQYIEKDQSVSFIKDASVSIEGNGQTDVLELTSKQDTFIPPWGGTPTYLTVFYYKGHVPLVANQTYTLKATREKKTITAETSLPAPVNIKSVKKTEYQLDGQVRTFYIAQFDDPKDTDDYYRLESCFGLMRPDSAGNPSGIVDWYCTDKINASYGYLFPVTDKYFFNNEGGLEIGTIPYSPFDSVSCKLHLRCYGKDFGDYMQSVQDQNGNGNNPLVEPTLLKSNIKGDGIGIFGGYTLSDEFAFKIKN